MKKMAMQQGDKEVYDAAKIREWTAEIMKLRASLSSQTKHTAAIRETGQYQQVDEKFFTQIGRYYKDNKEQPKEQ